MSVQNIIIKGTALPVVPGISNTDEITRLKGSYLIGGTLRGGGEEHHVKLDKNDLVELLFEDDTTWYCNRDTLEQVFPEASTITRSGGSEVFQLPSGVAGLNQERGVVSSILLKGLNIFTKKAVSHKIKDIAADLEKKQLDNKSGLYFLDKDFQFAEFAAPAKAGTFLLFIHGTASSAKGSFGELPQTELWPYLFQAYPASVLAFQHETLTKSPLENVLELVQQLPADSSLDLITHSRGGLVGEILARFCNANDKNKGFDKNEMAYLAKCERINDIATINEIKTVLLTKKISIKRYIRVACPAQGTILASKKMDNFFNVILNLAGVAGGILGSPAYVAFKNLIAAIIDCKNDVDVLPGLEAMNPDSAFIKVINSPGSEVIIDSPLIVVAGNCKTKLNLKALVIICSKLFFAKDNDLVVNTKSMYSGSRRTSTTQYLFDDATDVDHFHYFKNTRTNSAILMALKAPAEKPVAGFSLLQPGSVEEMERNTLLKLDGGQVFKDNVTGTRPIAIVLPGIMGSNLSDNDKLIWINYLRFVSGGLSKLNIKATNIQAPSIISTSYKKLVNYLYNDYDVVTFSFDWRLQLNKIASLFNDKIKSLLAYNQPIKIIGHSMGGVLVRDFIIQHNDTWQKLNASPGFKLLFLGAPLGGSFRIPFVLFGKDGIIEKLSKIDIFHTKKELLGIFSRLPGLLSLLPLTTDEENDFANPATWARMAENIGDWPLPLDKDLKDFEKYRNDIISKAETIDYSNIVYIAGKDDSTPCGYKINDTNSGRELVFLSTVEGDQSVTWESGIPKKMIDNNSVYYANVSHGSLSNEPGIFQGISDIISTGSTTAITRSRPEFRGVKKTFVAPEQHDLDITPEGLTTTLLGLGESKLAAVKKIEPLTVSVTNADLKYATYPLLAGHFEKDGILNAEQEIDRNLNMALSIRHQLNIYPGAAGTSEVFIQKDNPFKGAIIAGLGRAGELTAFELTTTIEQGICNYLLKLETDMLSVKNSRNDTGISSLIIGSGYGGLSIENAVRAVIQGIQNANARVRKLRPDVTGINHLEFIELYEDAALSCLYTISKIEKEDDSSLKIVIGNRKIEKRFGSRQRIQSQSTEGWWNRITVSRTQDETRAAKKLSFSASTGGAREERRDLFVSGEFMDNLLDDMSSGNNWSAGTAKTIFELLIPNDFKQQLKRRCNIHWILDRYTASYPWELLQDSDTDEKPLSVSAGMIRQYGTSDYRTTINFVATPSALVIGDPDLEGASAPQLPGAKKEAQLVTEILNTEGIETQTSINGTSAEIIKKMFSQNYKIIHLAGHGMFSEQSPESSGMLIGRDTYLTTAHISQMSGVPELVFVNCCFLGKTDGAAEELYKSRYKLAANIGTQLIENGVKAVVAAGWAVDDAAAFDFTERFYKEMFAGANFGEAIQRARKEIYERHSGTNTWGAYQCYGDAFYKFDIRKKQAKKYAPEFLIAEEAAIELNNLNNVVEMGSYDHQTVLSKLSVISKAIDTASLREPYLTEKEGFIYADLHEYDLALQKFKSVMDAEEASFSVETLESYCSLRSKKCVADFVKTKKVTAKLATEINSVIDDLKNLLYIGETAERLSLIGSAYKRKALLTNAAIQKIAAYKAAAYYYQKAGAIPNNKYPVYTLTNWYEMESILVMLGHRKWNQEVTYQTQKYKLPQPAEMLSELNSLKNKLVNTSTGNDYWKENALVNIELCRIITEPATVTKEEWKALLQTIMQTWKHAGSSGKKKVEIEHLQILTDALKNSKKRPVVQLYKMLQQLYKDLEPMV